MSTSTAAELNRALLKASSDDEIVRALAMIEALKAEKEDPGIPYIGDLCSWLPHCPREAKEVAHDRLRRVLYDDEDSVVHDVEWAVCAPTAQVVVTLIATAPDRQDHETVGKNDVSPTLTDVHAKFVALVAKAAPTAVGSGDGDAPTAVPDQRPTHPLGPIVAAWQCRPLEVEANNRPDPLFPEQLSLLSAPATRVRAAGDRNKMTRESPDLTHGFSTAREWWLPSLAPGEVDGEPNPEKALPLELWDLASGSPKSGNKRGAPLAARIFVDIVLDVKRKEWQASADRGVFLPPERFHDFLRRLYPDSADRWDTRRLKTLLQAFEMLEDKDMRIAWYDPATKRGGARRVVVPVDVPRGGQMKDWVRFAVFLPPCVTDGPLIDRPALRRAGVKTAAAWRLILSLSVAWAKPGQRRRPVRGGRHWMQRKTWSAYDPVTPDMLTAMAFPRPGSILSSGAQRKRRQRARTALKYLEAVGFAEQQEDGRAKRIRPGSQWVGWVGRKETTTATRGQEPRD